MSTATLLFTTQPGISSGLIRRFDGYDSSHVGILLPDNSVVDSTFWHGGVRRWSHDDFMQKRTLMHRVTFPVPRLDDGVAWLTMQIGKPYDWTALAGWLLWFDWQEDDCWYCSELAVAFSQACGRSVSGAPRRIGIDMARKLSGAWAEA